MLVNRERYLGQIPLTLITDCKSHFDQITGPTLSAARDRENQHDAVILRGRLSRLRMVPRWAPGVRQVADAMTTDPAGGARVHVGREGGRRRGALACAVLGGRARPSPAVPRPRLLPRRR